MKKALFYPITLVVLLILQMLAANYLNIKESFPNLFLLATIYFALRHGAVTGMTFGFFSGLIQDTFITGPFGANALINTLIGFVVSFFQRKVYEDNKFVQSGLVVISSFVYCWSIVLVQYVFNNLVYTMPFSRSIVFSLYNGIVAPLVFMALSLWESKYVAGNEQSAKKYISK